MTTSERPSEQFCARRFIDRAWNEFKQRTFSHSSIYILWGSFKSTDELVHRYLTAKGEGHLLGDRSNLTIEEIDRRDFVTGWAQEAVEYRDWARGEGGDPILRDLIVSYCAAFENALKQVAFAFRVAEAKDGCVDEIYMDAAEFRRMRKCVLMHWKKSNSEARAKSFYETEVWKRNPRPDLWEFGSADDGGPTASPSSIDQPKSEASMIRAKAKQSLQCNSPKSNWLIVTEAFKLRNKILHQNGYIDKPLEFRDHVVPAGDEVLLDVLTVRRASTAMRILMDPINPLQL